MELLSCKCESSELLFRHDDAFLIGIGVEFGMDLQASLCRRVGDEFDDDLPTHEGNCPPVRRDVTEHAMLDFVPLARARWVVRHRDRETCLIRKFLEFQFEEARATGITPSAIGSDVQLTRICICLPPHAVPPPTDCLHGKFPRVFVDAHGHESFVLRDVVDAVGNGFPQDFVDEIMGLHCPRLSFGHPLLSTILVISDEFLLLCINGNDRVSTLLKRGGCLMDVEKLCVTVGMRGTLLCFALSLATELLRLAFIRHGCMTHSVTFHTEFFGELARTLASPADTTHR